MKKYLHKKVKFYRIYDEQRKLYTGETIGIVEEVHKKNLCISGTWYHITEMFKLEILS